MLVLGYHYLLSNWTSLVVWILLSVAHIFNRWLLVLHCQCTWRRTLSIVHQKKELNDRYICQMLSFIFIQEFWTDPKTLKKGKVLKLLNYEYIVTSISAYIKLDTLTCMSYRSDFLHHLANVFQGITNWTCRNDIAPYNNWM